MDIILKYINEYQYIFMWIGITSVILFIASLVLIPIFIKKMPVDYFINNDYHNIHIKNTIDLTIFILKNTIGFILILAGIIMLFTPGQGIIAIVIGLFLMQFKGKFLIEKKIIQNNISFKTLNWIREKTKQPPFKR